MVIQCSASEEPITSETTPLLVDRDADGSERQSESRLCTGPQAPQSDIPSTVFSWTPFISILFMSLVQPLCFELIFPFISEFHPLSNQAQEIIYSITDQMIVENGVVRDPEDVGYYSGFIESIFQFMSFITSTSLLSDTRQILT